MGITTGYKRPDGVDIGTNLVEKSYLIDRYPELADTFKQAGLWAWGFNNYGQLGNDTVTNYSSPIQTVSGGTSWNLISNNIKDHVGAIKTDGTLWLWGRGTNGQLGTNAITSRSSPVQTIAGGTNWKQVSCGLAHTAAIKTDGTLWLWGSGSSGMLGTNAITSRSSPVQTIAAGTNWKQVSCGVSITSAIKTDGTLWTWGLNSNGQLGDNTITNRSSPVQTIAAGTNWKQVACGSSHTAAIKTDGTLWLWGVGSNQRLGNNSTLSRSSPVQTIAGGANWKQVACGDSHTAAIKIDGTLWLWGNNGFGQIGNNDRTIQPTPVQTISGGTNWKQVSLGDQHTAAIKIDGTLWLWGGNGYPQLGDGTTAAKSSPIQTIAGGTNWNQIVCGRYHAISIRDDSSDLL